MSEATDPNPVDPGRWHRCASAGLSFRRVWEADAPFLLKLYASTRLEELGWLEWTDRQKDAFINLQAKAQDAEYARTYPNAERWIVQRQDVPIGRLYLRRTTIDIEIIDLSLLPQERRQGLGTAALYDVIDDANSRPGAVTMKVEKSNPAMQLFRRIGFTTMEDKGVYEMMRRAPGALPSGI